MLTAQQEDELAKLDKAVENSSEKNRNFFIGYLGLLIYVQAIVFSTTDLQLLVSTERLKLPIVDLTVSLVGFYVVVPIFVIALHFNFLQNLDSHHYKLMRWQEAHPGGVVPRSRLHPFLFDYAILERSGQFLGLVKWANYLLCIEFAPLTLGLMLIRYTDRQDVLVTAWHGFAFVLDNWLVWKMNLAMEENRYLEPPPATVSSRWAWASQSWCFLRNTFNPLSMVVLFEFLLTLLIAGIDGDYFVVYVQPWAQVLKEKKQEILLPRIAIDPSEIVWRPDVNTLKATAKLAGQDDWVKYFNEHGKGFQPAIGSSLRLLSLPQQNLSRAQLRGVRLQGADLLEAQMQGANLMRAQMQGANMGLAELQGANLESAQMQGADLGRAQMQGADLGGAQMQGAILNETAVQSASGTSKTAVFGIKGQSGLFEEKKPDWDGIEKMAETLPDAQRREAYRQRIRQAAKPGQVSDAEQNLRYAPTVIAQAALSEVCKPVEYPPKDARKDAAQAFRRRYHELPGIWGISYGDNLKQNSEYQALLQDIDRTLCTLEACADLREDIEGLDCKTYIQNLPKKS